MSHLLFPLTVLLGALAGWLGLMPAFVSEYSLPHLLLYALIIQVGLGLGMRPDIKKIIKGFNPRLLLLPVCTIVGTLSFTFLATLLFKGDSSSDLMAIGSGFGYYTLSSVLIVQFKEAAVCRIHRGHSTADKCSPGDVRSDFMPVSVKERTRRNGNLGCWNKLDGRMSANDCRHRQIV